ncbi:NADH-quinone oxidoreductase subunit K [Nesterenkonia ebinurensis]|uniref:NADH-quinone oxidoreductase subunit K n=1 Tax=Nesterenkonia ebinurensis TaxID=2608252 RepID=UPI00123D8068|nr:NADH-quinone oxidoreductase subunit K [Nesterenkonia ebinurensis]
MLLQLDTITWYLMIASAVTVFGMVRLLLVRDRLARLIALDVTGIGVLLTLVALAARADAPDAVLQALVITGLVIAVAFTGLGAVLIRRIEGAQDTDGGDAR